MNSHILGLTDPREWVSPPKDFDWREHNIIYVNIYMYKLCEMYDSLTRDKILVWKKWPDVGVRGICNHYKGEK